MGANVDKLDELLLGRSLLEWSVAAMAAASSVARIVIVTRGENVDRVAHSDWLAALGPHPVDVVAGGEHRSESVRNGVFATGSEVVLVHDAARPLASSGLADAVAAAALQYGAAVPVVPVVDSVKRAADGRLESIDRSGLVRTQTPQGARRDILVEALAAARGTPFTDEAALLESRGVPVATVPGDARNMKVTEPADLDLVRAIAQPRADTSASGPGDAEFRVGMGQDTHGFGPDLGLRLGGVAIDDAPRLFGHSDGDVVLHAIATAVLAAAGLGDLGRLFPATDVGTAGIASDVLLAETLDRARRAGRVVSNVQVSLVGARPRLGAQRIDSMRARIAELLGIDETNVAITASTGNLYGPEGAGRAMSATSLVVARRR